MIEFSDQLSRDNWYLTLATVTPHKIKASTKAIKVLTSCISYSIP